MKNLLLIILISSSIQLNAQVEKKILSELSSNEFTILSNTLEDRVDICILDEQDFVTKDQAILDVKAFISSHPLKSWNIVHNGNSKGNESRYVVAELVSDINYRMILYFDSSSDTEKISEVRIEN